MRSLSISLAPNGFQLFLPGTNGEGHHVTIPESESGLRILRRLLSEADPTPQIGKRSAPTQAQVEAWLRADRAREAALVDLAELGL